MSFLEELGHFRIPLKDIREATNNFGDENVIGEGGYRMVYEGKLLNSKGLSRVAVKRVSRYFSHAKNEFSNEMRVLSSYKHVNIVSLVGFCDEYDEYDKYHEKIVVQEFMANGSLDKYLSSAKLTWLKRLQICLGAAYGLSYLHNGLKGHSVFHCDVRSRTILLDENWQAKVGGFGLSVMDPVHPHFFVNGGIGAPGYVDPVYLQTGVVTKEADVYSFGVVLFEVLCGRLAYERYEEDNRQLLGPFARLNYKEGKLNEIIDPILREQIDQDSLEAFSSIAYQCLNKNRSERPTMIHIVQKLEQVLRLQQEFEKALELQQVAIDLKGNEEDVENSYKVKNLEHMKVPLKQIKSATNDFHDAYIIGHGGYGKVYKAELFHFDVQKHIKQSLIQGVSVTELLGYQRRKSMVAVKRLDRTYGQGTSEFLQEIFVLSNFRHKNLVSLVGYCDEDSERILVYEYASNGSLDKYFSSSESTNNLTWPLRLQICLDAAHGLEFLHNGVGEHYRIIHRDIKSSNILLGQNLVGKISDFGLSRIGPANLQATFVMTRVAGTLEYVDPQYHKTGVLTKGSDVYSFGVVLFEVLSGRLAYFQKSKDDNEFLPHMAKRCFEQKMLHMIIDPKLKNEFEKSTSFTSNDETFPDSIRIYAETAYKCLQENRDDRPTMADVVEELEKALKSQVKGVEALRISLDAIKKATNNFSGEMKHEAYGMVYKGELSHSKGRDLVIVKRLDRIMHSYETEFYKEVAKLYSYSHNNVIPILGFCDEKSERLVIFEHMVNGSVKEHLKNTGLTWKQRIKISIGAARGLAYIHTQHSTHGDIKSSNILLNHDWKAVISNIIISKSLGTLGYYDPLYDVTGMITQKSDVYAFGVVLFEILSGRSAIEMLKMDQQGLHEGEDGQVIIFPGIRGQIDAKSLLSFSTIAHLCLRKQPGDRPTMGEVVKELELSLECQDEWEWEQKLPEDYMKILHMSKYPVSTTSKKKDLYTLLSSGILLDNGKLWFSISTDGTKDEMVSARKFSLENVKWRSIRNSRFSKVAKISDISKLNIQVQIKTQFLTRGIMYGAYLVFKFCDRKKFSSRPLYVNLKYKMAGESLNAYFAEWRAGSKWLTVELFRFWNNKEIMDFNVLLESFSRYHCGNGGVFIEGIEFNAIRSLENKENNILNVETNVVNVRGRLRPELEIEWAQQMAIQYNNIINRSEINFQNVSLDELRILLYKGILIDKGDKIFSVSKVNKMKCHMLPAKAVIYDPPNVLSYSVKTQTPTRYQFAEFVEILPRHEFHIKCDIEKQLLSSDTIYACFLVFKLSEKCRGLKCPVKARELLPFKKERTKIISFTPPSTVNLDKVKWLPQQREDGWMEVKIWETISDRYDDETIPMDLKLICCEGNMLGLIVYGIEFRPM